MCLILLSLSSMYVSMHQLQKKSQNSPLPLFAELRIRVARWHSFKPKIPIWVIFGGSRNWDVGILYGHLVFFRYLCNVGHSVYFMVIWYIFYVLVCCTKRNLATLLRISYACKFDLLLKDYLVRPRVHLWSTLEISFGANVWFFSIRSHL
jgi:hypothetical protein